MPVKLVDPTPTLLAPPSKAGLTPVGRKESDGGRRGVAAELRRFRRSLGFAANGLAIVWRDEPNFRIEVAVAAGALLLTWMLNASLTPIILVCGLVLAAEIVNSAIEAVVDLACPTYSVVAKRAKDMAAGAVLLCALVAVGVGVVHLGPPLWGVVFG